MAEYKYEAFLSRIEVIRGPSSDVHQEPSQWDVAIEEAGQFVLLTGVLRTHCDAGMGQALVHGALLPTTLDGSKADVEEARNSVAASGCIEAMYDLARRSVNMQAAVMDFSFDLATKAPKVSVDLKEPHEHSGPLVS
ncbi:hypothetical protein [Arthrobacter sp. QXT-31]|uniref:hypothetical protein n=1 Tax=Arthrobacter sp. QXT-31 TaxID=1357915 RepID=UPI00097178ED|nr:hypothetical protein [Arthrobacter sp. QXT-31]APX01168.1 hypothetical protein BWQ92_04985 [Arthrobacter sp. QXT-31]